MYLNLTINLSRFRFLKRWFASFTVEQWILFAAVILATSATVFSFVYDLIIVYGDSESHLNISKRIVDSLTPGLAQLGGIWLPLPHLLLTPLVNFDILWRTGLAGSIVSGVAFVVSSVYLYKLTYLLTKNTIASVVATFVFMLNPNVLYLQSTPMTELPLIVFFILSSYYFVKFLFNADDLVALLLAALFGFFATLSRYDGWFLVLVEAGIIMLLYVPYVIRWQRLNNFRIYSIFGKKLMHDLKPVESLQQMRRMLDGKLFLFSTLAFFGIALWLSWDALILGDPLFFTHSQFSAKSQQLGWFAKGQLPAYRDIIASFSYYFVTAMSNVGVVIYLVSTVGLFMLLINKTIKHRVLVVILFMVPFLFYVITLFMGQSIIFIPHLTPQTFEWTLFNARYGVMMVPVAAILFGYLFYKCKPALKTLLVVLFLLQFMLYGVGYSKVLSLEDGVNGLSTAKRPDAEFWLAKEYDGGLVLLDDFSRLMSIIRSGIPMENVIYIGNKPYWEESLLEPEKYARWIIIQKEDDIWDKIFVPEEMQGRLYKHFEKVYTSPDILIFRKNDSLAIRQ